MKPEAVQDVVVGCGALLLAAGALLLAKGFPSAAPGVPGPAVFPVMISAVLALMGLALVVRGIRRAGFRLEARRPRRAPRPGHGRSSVPEPARSEDLAAGINVQAGRDGDSPGTVGRARVLSVLGATVVYGILMPVIGFVTATTLWAAGLMLLLGYRHKARAAAIALTAALVVYLLFAEVMNVPLPDGWFG